MTKKKAKALDDLISALLCRYGQGKSISVLNIGKAFTHVRIGYMADPTPDGLDQAAKEAVSIFYEVTP